MVSKNYVRTWISLNLIMHECVAWQVIRNFSCNEKHEVKIFRERLRKIQRM